LCFSSSVDYAANNMPPKFPHGLDCEIFAADLLFAAEKMAKLPYQREHVTPWMRTHPSLTKANLRGPGGGTENLRWTLDEAADLEFFRQLATSYGPGVGSANAGALLAFCLRRPDLVAINQKHTDLARLQNADQAALQSAPYRLLDVA
ncbi:hypothetical protein MNBD_ALPHA06-821, partial [hydrothermal vent metagenome]